MSLHTPQCITKELQLASGPNPGQRRIRISTNFLQIYGFTPGTRLEARPRSNGFDLLPSTAPAAPWKVHQRCYPQRRNNPTESIIDIQANDFINHHIPTDVNRLHYTLRSGVIEARLVYPQLFNIRKAMKQQGSRELNAFLALSSGLDAICLREAGFSIKAVLEYRPPEARDASRDLSETGVCTFLANNKPQFVFNEDITRADLNRIARITRPATPIALLNLGLQCDDHSTAQAPSHKKATIAQFLPSARELAYYAMKLIETLTPATILIEQVPGWNKSESQAIMGAVMRRMGYHVQSTVLSAADFGAFTKRERCYFIASIWPGFQFPEPTGKNQRKLGEVLADLLPTFRDQSHTKTVAAARGTPRQRFCSLEETQAGTILKSQARQTKDSVYFTDRASRVLLPTVAALQRLQGFEGKLDLSQVNEEIATEQLGQGVDFPLHHAVSRALHNHIRQNLTAHRSQQLSLCLDN